MHDPQAVPAIDLSGDLSFEQWLEIGAELGRAEDRLQWAIGDWWVYGEHRYGRRKAIVEAPDWQAPHSRPALIAAPSPVNLKLRGAAYF